MAQLFLDPWVAGVARDFCIQKKENVCANEGFHSDGQWYLFEKIWQLCSSQSAGSVCPKPTVPNPTDVVEEEFANEKKETE